MNIDTTITIDTLLNTGLALLGWFYIMFSAGKWAASVFLKQWGKRRKQEKRQKALEAFYDAFELSRIEPIELNTGQETIVIAHADYPDREYQFGKAVPLFNVIWSRDRVSDSIDGIGEEITGADRFIFGHTPAKSPKAFWNQHYIDTGAVFCGNLTLMQVKGGQP